MDLKQLKEMVAEGEGLHVEFKRKANFPEKIVKEVVAFANTDGGWLLIGVDDSGEIAGVDNPEGDQYVMEFALTKYIQPSIKYELHTVLINKRGSGVLAYYIPAQSSRPYATTLEEQRTVYYRVADRSIQASAELRELMKLGTKGKHLRFEVGIKEQQLLQYLEENGSITVDVFAQIAGVSRRRASRTLVLLTGCNVLKIHPAEGADLFTLHNKAFLVE